MESNSDARTLNETRIREITRMYYSLPYIKKAIFDFSQSRECVPRYFEGFGKRPDNFQYEQDIIEQVKKGATSFHCSEELWQDSLEISNELNREQFNELRIGWDLLLDIDSPYLEYSKIYAGLLIETLRFHDIENIGVKYSGSKGFHIIIPWKAFPEEIYNQKTKDMFPEWPRIICQYLSSLIQPKLGEIILQDENLKELALKTGKKQEDLMLISCLSCKRPVQKKFLITWLCPNCKNEITVMEGHYNNRRKAKCPNPECRKPLTEKLRKEIFICEYCNTNSNKNPELFEKKERFATEKLIDADLVLVAPRHLFRMPYSLHEKTSLSSIVIDKDKIKDFQITDAKPLKVQVKDFYPIPKKNEAKNLLLQALDWNEQNQQKENKIELTKKTITPLQKKTDYKKLSIPNPPEFIFPPQIKQILKGVKQDGRKRALFILLSFFTSIGTDEKKLEEILNQWNEKNYNPLKKGYIQSQLIWFKRQKSILPPNFDNPIYKDLGILDSDELSRKLKNPVNYAVKKYFGKS